MPSKINTAGAGQRPASLAQNPMLTTGHKMNLEFKEPKKLTVVTKAQLQNGIIKNPEIFLKTKVWFCACGWLVVNEQGFAMVGDLKNV